MLRTWGKRPGRWQPRKDRVTRGRGQLKGVSPGRHLEESAGSDSPQKGFSRGDTLRLHRLRLAMRPWVRTFLLASLQEEGGAEERARRWTGGSHETDFTGLWARPCWGLMQLPRFLQNKPFHQNKAPEPSSYVKGAMCGKMGKLLGRAQNQPPSLGDTPPTPLSPGAKPTLRSADEGPRAHPPRECQGLRWIPKRERSASLPVPCLHAPTCSPPGWAPSQLPD